MLAQGKPLRRSTLFKYSCMRTIRIILDVCERLFEELVKELLKDRFTVVSGSFREIDGRKVHVRKAHLRKRKRWRQIAFWSALGLMPLLSIRVSQWESFRAWGLSLRLKLSIQYTPLSHRFFLKNCVYKLKPALSRYNPSTRGFWGWRVVRCLQPTCNQCFRIC